MSDGPNSPHEPSGSPLSNESQSLLQSAPRPRAMSLAERKVAAQTVAKIAATPVAVVGGMTVAKMTLATVATVSAAAMLARTIQPHAETQATNAAVTTVSTAPAQAPIARTAAPRSEPARSTPTLSPTIQEPTRAATPAPTVTVRATAPAPRHTNSTAPVVVAPSAQGPVIAPVAPVLAPIAQPSPVATPSAQPSALSGSVGGAHSLSGGTLSEPPEQRETNALEQVFTVVGSDPSRAMAMLDAFDREFPRGRLRDEREFLGVLALDRLGRRDEARTRARALLQRSPSGIYAPRLRRLLEQSP